MKSMEKFKKCDTIIEQMKEIRRVTQCSQRDLSLKYDIPISRISSAERGFHVSNDTIFILIKRFGKYYFADFLDWKTCPICGKKYLPTKAMVATCSRGCRKIYEKKGAEFRREYHRALFDCRPRKEEIQAERLERRKVGRPRRKVYQKPAESVSQAEAKARLMGVSYGQYSTMKRLENERV